MKLNILLLTNRDSDNIGDQIIEACNISLIKAVLQNLRLTQDEYHINSRACSIISEGYIKTKNGTLLNHAIKKIDASNLIIFGGAPVFNYSYQHFYERTAITLELANQYNKPVIFSGIGVEKYNTNDKRCQRLKKTLEFSCIKQATTRDDLDSLKQYIENTKIPVAKVADPAVFSANVFKKWACNKSGNPKKIGIFVFRKNGFKDNKYDFTKNDQAKLWIETINCLTNKGYDYELLTSGHYGDEVFLDFMIRHYSIDPKKCIFNVNTPEKLAKLISSYDGIIACRLHPSIISYSFEVPSVGITWNQKVPFFYESIGYPDRVFTIDNLSPEKIVESLEKAMNEGVHKDPAFLMSIYISLFNALKNIYRPNTNIQPYDYNTLLNKIHIFKGTSESEKQKKLIRKMRRIYKDMNKKFVLESIDFQNKNNLKYFIKRLLNQF